MKLLVCTFTTKNDHLIRTVPNIVFCIIFVKWGFVSYKTYQFITPQGNIIENNYYETSILSFLETFGVNGCSGRYGLGRWEGIWMGVTMVGFLKYTVGWWWGKGEERSRNGGTIPSYQISHYLCIKFRHIIKKEKMTTYSMNSSRSSFDSSLDILTSMCSFCNFFLLYSLSNEFSSIPFGGSWTKDTCESLIE